MTGAIAPLNDFNLWVRDDLLVIVLLVLGAILLTRLAAWTRDKIMAHIEARATETDELVRSEGAKHRQVVAQVVTWSALAVIYVVTGALIVQKLGVPLQVTEAVLGHTSGSRGGIVGIYQRHDYADEKRAALESWGAHVMAIVGPSS